MNQVFHFHSLTFWPVFALLVSVFKHPARGYSYFLIVFEWLSGLEKKIPKFEGVLEVNSILAQTQTLYKGQLVGPESLAADSTGDQTL